MSYKIGFHTGPAGNPTGIGEHFRALIAANKRVGVKSVDHYGPCHELANLGGDSYIVFRLSTRGQNDGFDYDVPRYELTPKSAAELHWTQTLAKLPPEFNKDKVWLEVINEVDKNRADWLGYFAYEISKLALRDGYKVALFGWSGGEPEIEHWKVLGMRVFLEYAGRYPDNIAVSLHEYSFTVDRLIDDVPYYLVGRFQQLVDACEEMNIRVPKIFVTEFGWEYRNVPEPAQAMPELAKAADLYASQPAIQFAYIWYLGGYFGDIHNQTQKLIQPVTEQALNYVNTAPPPVEPPPIDPDIPFKDRLWKMSIDRQVSHGIQLAPTAIQERIRRDGYHPVTDEVYGGDDPPWMAAEDWATRTKPRRVYWWEGGQVHYIQDGSATQPPPEPTPPPVEPPPSGQIDLLPYFCKTGWTVGPTYELRSPAGWQQRCQVHVEGNKFYLTKGTGGKDGKSEWEELAYDQLWIWRGVDTSPGNGRFYVQYEPGKQMARWCPRFMSVGQEWVGAGHQVQFFFKSGCGKSSPNSGPARNHIKLYSVGPADFNGLHFESVAHLGRPGGEEFWFAQGVGMIGWKSEWGESFISELHLPGARPNNQREEICKFTI